MAKMLFYMLAPVAAFNALASAAPIRIDLVTWESLVEPQGVSLDAQLPEPGLTLLPKDPQRPKLWYAPVSAEATRHGARIWHQRVNSAETEFPDQRTLCLGEIRDSVWNLCPLDSAEPAWGGTNNVCMRRSPFKPTWGGFNVFQILRTGHKYRMLYWDQPSQEGQAGAMLATSRDGEVWRKDPCGAVFTEHNDAFTLLSHKGEYLLYQTALEDWPDKPYPDNLDKKRRVITLRRSRDLRSWTPQELLLHPDAQDKPETEFYLMKAFPYGSGFAGLIMKYFADPKLPGKHSAIIQDELVVSADAIHWERPFRGTDVGFWSYADPFLLDGKLHFAVWKDGGMCTVTYAPQRMTAVCAGNETGVFMTRPFRYSGGPITLNADAKDGWIQIELLTEAGERHPGASDQRIERVDGTNIRADVGLGKQPGPDRSKYRLRLKMQRARLYAIAIDQGTR